MRGFQLTSPDPRPVLTEVPEPIGGDASQRVVTVLAAGLNPVDVGLARRPNPPDRPSRTLGLEGVFNLAGQVVYVEHAVSPHGTFADRSVITVTDAVPLPAELDPAAAVPLGISGLAAWIPIEKTAALEPGETVVVLGATGTCGQVAVQAARLLGAGRVVAVGRNVERLERLRDRGADAVVVLGGDDDAAAIKDATEGGSDVIYDTLFGAPLVAALKSAKPGARSVTVGNLAGNQIDLAFFDLFGKSLVSYQNGMAAAELKSRALRTMAGHAVRGELVVEYEEVPLDSIASAWDRQIAGPGTKLVVVP